VSGGGVTLVLGAVFAGLVGAIAWGRWPVQPAAVDTSAIQWNAVQAVPRRAPDAEDVAWQKRGEAPLAEPVIASPEGARQSSLDGFDKARDDGGETSARTDIHVIDGDTFSVGGQRIRVAGIDAPETHPPRCMEEARLGLAATQKLKELLGSGTVTISGSGHDQYGRELREVRVNGRDVGEAMLAAGLARSYAGEKRQEWC
jgi:endonuclease YncB( thermonuclease family)